MIRLTFARTLAVDRATLWQAITSPEAIHHEMRTWRHERRLEDSGTGCTLHDTLVFELQLLPKVTPAIIGDFSHHRHRRRYRRYC